MNSLIELNGYSSTAIEVIDQRLSNVIFDRINSIDQIVNIDLLNITIPVAANIIEIINYETANVRYQIAIKSSTNPTFYTTSSIQFDPLPLGVTLSQSLGVYVLSGINSRAIWNQVKFPTWRLPSNYFTVNNFYLEVRVIWYSEELGADQYRQWLIYDPDYYKVAELNSTANVAATGLRIKQLSAGLTSRFTQQAEQGPITLFNANLFTKFEVSNEGAAIGITTFAANMSAQAFLIAGPVRIRGMANISGMNFSLAVTPNARFRGRSNVFSAAAASSGSTITTGITNMTNRTYLSNVVNNIFATSTPIINDPVAGVTYTITLSSPNGEFGTTTTAFTTYSFTGTISQINTNWSNIRFFPTKDFTGNTTFTYTQSKGGITTVSRTLSMTFAGAGTVPTLKYEFFSNATWTPTLIEKKYSVFDYLLVGGGGAGGSKNGTTSAGSGGGGSGGVKYEVDQPILLNSYSLTIGTGGAPVSGANGGNGTSTTGFGFTVGGGLGGGRAQVGGSFGLPGRGGENATGAGGGFGTGTMYNLNPLGGGGGSSFLEAGYYRTNDVFNQAPGDGGVGVLYPNMYNFLIAAGGQGGYGSRAGIGINGSGNRGSTVGNPGCGGGGGGGGAAPESTGGSGENGIVVVRTHG
jgi:hypothetical protein